MNFTVFTLHPNLFDSFRSESLVARAISKEILSIKTINWRENYGVGKYRQIDDRPYGGGSGMVLQPDQIYRALLDNNAVSPLFKPADSLVEYTRQYPRNDEYFEFWQQQKSQGRPPRSITINLSPRGYQFTQPMAHWLSEEFDSVSLVCGRYEGFDARASELFDMELSLGPYVVNGGEVPAMTLIEAIGRLLPDFVTKNPSVMHDSFSASLNQYDEMEEYVVGSRRKQQLIEAGDPNKKLPERKENQLYKNLFDKYLYLKTIAPFIEHPQFTRPQTWMNYSVPEILLNGDHKEIAKWRSQFM